MTPLHKSLRLGWALLAIRHTQIKAQLKPHDLEGITCAISMRSAAHSLLTLFVIKVVSSQRVATYSTRLPESLGLDTPRASLPWRSGLLLHDVAACTWQSVLLPVVPLSIVPAAQRDLLHWAGACGDRCMSCRCSRQGSSGLVVLPMSAGALGRNMLALWAAM